MAKTKKVDYAPTLLKASVIPFAVVPALLYGFSPETFGESFGALLPYVLLVWGFTMLLALKVPRRLRYTRILTAKGAHIGLILTAFVEFKGLSSPGEVFPAIAGSTWLNWIVLLAIAGFFAGMVCDATSRK